MDRRTAIAATGVFAAGALLLQAHAQTFPSRPVTFLVPWPAGGNSDFTSRLMAPELSRHLGQPVVIENAGGAGGVVGLQRAMQASGDGHLVYFGGAEMFVPPMVNPKLTYNWRDHLTPVGTISRAWFVLAVSPTAPYNTLQEFIQYARKNPGKVSYASPGIATSQHFVGEIIRERAKIAIVHVPYRGGAAMISDVLGGQIEMAILTVNGVLPYLRDKRMKVLAVSSPTRVPQLANTPAFLELPEFEGVSLGGMQVMMTSKSASPAAIQKLTAALEATMKAPEVIGKLTEVGAEVKFEGGNTALKIIEEDALLHKRIVEFSKMRVDS